VNEEDVAKDSHAKTSAQPHKHEQTISQTPSNPTLSGYYSNASCKPSSFIKAARAAKTKMFQSQDIAAAHAMLAEQDPDLSRTLALVVGNHPPDAVERWAIEAAKSSVRALDPEFTRDGSASADAILERTVRVQAEALQSKSKAPRLRAQNLIRLTLFWLIRERSIEPLQALHALSNVSSKRVSREASRAQAQRLLLQSKPGLWRALSTVASLSFDAVQRADRAAVEAGQARDRLQERIIELERALQEKQLETNTLSHEMEHLRSENAARKSSLEEERKLRELDLSQAAARTRHLLEGRLSLLVSDARSALDFEPPHIEAARQRLDAAKETIAKEVSNSHE
jgi:hypothetical protein